MFLGIKLEGWLTIAAILLGPMLAFAIQQWRDRLREDRNRKRQIFQQLLLTLRAPMAPRHIDALNSIPLEFHSSATVMQAWREYTSHLKNHHMLKANSLGWGEKKFELLIALTFDIAKSLGYEHIDKAALTDNIYVPQGYEDVEVQFQQLRTSLLQVLKGERPISTAVVGPVQMVQPLPSLEPDTPTVTALPEVEVLPTLPGKTSMP